MNMMRVRGMNLSRRLTPNSPQHKWALLCTVHTEDEEGSYVFYPDGTGEWRRAPSLGWEDGITYSFEPKEHLYLEDGHPNRLNFYARDSEYRQVFSYPGCPGFTTEYDGVLTARHFLKPNRPLGKAIYIYQPDGNILQYRATCPWVEIPLDEQKGCLTVGHANKGEILRGLHTLEADVVVYGESLKDDAEILNIARYADGSIPCLHAFYLWWATTPGSIAGDLLYSSAPAEISSVLLALCGEGELEGRSRLREILDQEAKRLLRKEFNLNIED